MNATSHAYIWQEPTVFIPRFCYIDSETCPVDLLGKVWRYHPGLCNYVEQEDDVWIACVSVRVNGAWTQVVRVPSGILIDALTEKIVHNDKGEEVRVPINVFQETY